MTHVERMTYTATNPIFNDTDMFDEMINHQRGLLLGNKIN